MVSRVTYKISGLLQTPLVFSKGKVYLESRGVSYVVYAVAMKIVVWVGCVNSIGKIFGIID